MTVTTQDLTIAGAARLLRSRKISPSELLELYLARIAAVDPQVQAWISLHTEAARAHARTLDNRRIDDDTSPLFGIPYGAKDIFHTRGMPTEGGSLSRKGFIPNDSAEVIDGLQGQGAILIGKTTTTEFANWGNPPKTGNPWNLAHTPGGSSSGSAAAMAARTALFTLGTQTAGSLSRPAAFNGLTALKATYGRITKAGVIPCSWSLDHVGAFTHTVEDAVLVFNAVSGPQPRDETTHGLSKELLHIRECHGLKLGVIDSPWFKTADPEILAAVDAALQVLQSEGCSLKSVSMPKSFEPANHAHGQVMQAECAAYHATAFRESSELFGAYLQAFLAEGLKISALDYIHAQRARSLFRAEFAASFDQLDVMVTPGTESLAPFGLQATGSPAYNMPFTNAGVPTLVLPIGISKTGLPMSMQLIAPPLQEQRLIDIGLRYQAVTDWHLRVPQMG